MPLDFTTKIVELHCFSTSQMAEAPGEVPPLAGATGFGMRLQKKVSDAYKRVSGFCCFSHFRGKNIHH
jgi:hypothetical protein